MPPGSVSAVRRLLILVGVLVFVDTMLYAALTPLLPHFEHELHLSKAGAGTLVAAYAAGALVGGLPGGWASARFGARRAVLAGLTAMGLASLAFAFAGSFTTLFLARFLQGLGSGFTWAGAFAWLLATAPRERRGELIGNAMGAAVFGALFGPVVGAAAAIAGRAVIFSALAGLSVVLGVWALRLPPPSIEPQPSFALVRRALRERELVAGLALMALPSLLFGILSTLAPLHLSRAGWGAAAIGAVWLVGSALEGIAGADRRPDQRPSRAVRTGTGLARARGARLARACCGVAPADLRPADRGRVVHVRDHVHAGVRADRERRGGGEPSAECRLRGDERGMGARGGHGAAAGGAIAGATGDWIPYLLAACACGVALVAVRSSTARLVHAEEPPRREALRHNVS